jgi:phenylacetic acid degradation operon negative regulatory protein
VAFLFGLAGRAELPGTALLQLLMDLGLSAPAARALLVRVRRQGLLGSTRRGREAHYRLAGAFAESAGRVVEYASRGSRPQEWTGAFHALIHRVPERDRSYRDALRRSALLAGYGLLQDGVLIALLDRHAVISDLLARRPAGARVLATQLAMETSDAARCAFEAWDLGELARTYLRHISDLERALSHQVDPPTPSARTLRRFAELARTPLTDTVRDPGLPRVLLPNDWPGERLREVIVQVHAVFGPAATAHVVNVLARSRVSRARG